MEAATSQSARDERLLSQLERIHISSCAHLSLAPNPLRLFFNFSSNFFCFFFFFFSSSGRSHRFSEPNKTGSSGEDKRGVKEISEPLAACRLPLAARCSGQLVCLGLLEKAGKVARLTTHNFRISLERGASLHRRCCWLAGWRTSP